jgi:hypothetical protein
MREKERERERSFNVARMVTKKRETSSFENCFQMDIPYEVEIALLAIIVGRKSQYCKLPLGAMGLDLLPILPFALPFASAVAAVGQRSLTSLLPSFCMKKMLLSYRLALRSAWAVLLPSF